MRPIKATYLLDDMKNVIMFEDWRLGCSCGWPNQLAGLEGLLVDKGVDHHAPEMNIQMSFKFKFHCATWELRNKNVMFGKLLGLDILLGKFPRW